MYRAKDLKILPRMKSIILREVHGSWFLNRKIKSKHGVQKKFKAKNY